MIKKFALVIGATLLVTCLQAQQQKAQKYAVKSGYIKLQLGGSTTGTREIWWDNYGDKTRTSEKSVTITKMFGIKSKEETNKLEITVKDKYWFVDYTDNSGMKGTLPYYNYAQEFANSMTEEEAEEFANEILEGLGGSNMGKEKVGNYTCDVIKIMGIKTWIYKGIALKTEGSVMGVATKDIYTEFKPNTSIPASKFVVPSNINFDDMDKRQQEYFGAMNMDDMDDMDDDEADELPPVKYSFDKFKNVINNFKQPGMVKAGVNSMDGRHAATFIQGLMGGSLMIIAQTAEEIKEEDGEFEEFSHNGHKCYYGKIDEEDGTALIVEYKQYNMHVFILALPEKSKSDMISISDKLKF